MEGIKNIEEAPNNFRVVFDNKEDAILMVKDYWASVPEGRLIFEAVERGNGDWTQELTMGDRTTITNRDVNRENRGKWVVIFKGNNQPLSKNSIDWLRSKGLKI